MPGCCYGAAAAPVGLGLIPPMRILAAEDHVTLAIGRDYTDVAPVDGVILGSGRQRMGVSVNVTPVQ